MKRERAKRTTRKTMQRTRKTAAVDDRQCISRAGDHLRMPGRGAAGDGMCSSFYYCIVLYFTYLYSQCESSVRE